MKKLITLFDSLLMRFFTIAIILNLVSLGDTFANKSKSFWTTPTIHGYGKSHYLSKAAYKPKSDQTYKVVFAITKHAKTPSKVNPALEHVARAVNLYVASGVPLNQLKFVAVVYGKATPIVLNDAHYKAIFGMHNPNIRLIQELRAAGVDVTVCSQAVSEFNYEYGWIDKNVTLSLSGLTTITTLEHEGYGLMQI